jgi:hypothetical protein
VPCLRVQEASNVQEHFRRHVGQRHRRVVLSVMLDDCVARSRLRYRLRYHRNGNTRFCIFDAMREESGSNEGESSGEASICELKNGSSISPSHFHSRSIQPMLCLYSLPLCAIPENILTCSIDTFLFAVAIMRH